MKNKIIIAKTKILKTDLQDLKKISGADTNKEALKKAIEHYIICSHKNGKKTKRNNKQEKRPGRKPIYIPEINNPK